MSSLKTLAKFSWLIYMIFTLMLMPAEVQPGSLPNSVRQKIEQIKTEQRIIVNYLSEKYQLSSDYVEKIVSSVYRHAPSFGLKPTMVLGLIETESSLDNTAQSKYGAVGLMQVVPRFHEDTIKDVVGIPTKVEVPLHKSKAIASQQKNALHEVDTNIQVGLRVLDKMMDKAGGNLEKALVSYSGSATKYSHKILVKQNALENTVQKEKIKAAAKVASDVALAKEDVNNNK